MSFITDVVVVADYVSQEQEAALLAPLEFDVERHQQLREIDMNGAGGFKVFCSHVYAGAFNYLPVSEFIAWITDLLGDEYTNAVVWMSTEGDNIEVFRPYGVVRGHVVEEVRWGR